MQAGHGGCGIANTGLQETESHEKGISCVLTRTHSVLTSF